MSSGIENRLRWIVATSVVALAGLNLQLLDAAEEADEAQRIIQATGVRGGLIVHLGCGDGKLTAALRVGEQYLVHGLDDSAENVSEARQHIRSLGIYGHVSADQLRGKELPYIDNLVNLVVAEELDGIAKDEVLRVLAPLGVAYVKDGDTWQKIVKPRPDNIDEWTHFMHDAGGNAVAHDDVVGPPRRLQWLGSPRWSRHHDRMASMSALVSAGGRIFYIMDEGSRTSIQLPPKWKLVARDAFNGTVLWKRDIPTWHSHLWPLKSGPTQLARRLVATRNTVFVTLGLRVPLTALDAATGETLQTYEETKATEEIIHRDGLLFVLANTRAHETADYRPQLNVGDQARVRKEYTWNEQARDLVAVEVDSGRVLWTKKTKVAPLTLSADGSQVYFHDGSKVVALSQKSGDEVWSSPPVTRRTAFNMNFGPKLVIYDKVVLFAGGDRKMTAFTTKDGEQLWTAPHAQSGYSSPEDILVAGGLVWNAPTTRTQDTGVFTGRDPLTGEVKEQFGPDVQTYWFHHRCHMAKATDKFLLPSRTGIEFVDPKKESWDINHWVRGGCLYGIMPCNGLVYTPPHNCACYPEAKLYGLNALAPASASQRGVSRDVRLEKGVAFDELKKSDDTVAAGDWPTYRGNASRSGFTKSAVASDLTESWTSELGGRLSSVVVANGRLYVAQVDAHTVHALDAKTGDNVWSYTTGGRVDSPPTIDGARVVFGSADGWVYCLRASDGELAWRYRAAPRDIRLSAFEQLESVWPVHGSVLVEDGAAYFVAGRSNYLDGGLRWYKLDVKTGEKLAEAVINEQDPETKENLQNRLQVLTMPVGLPDVLSSDGKYIYMRSQQFDRNGGRHDLGPHSGQPAVQGSVQRGETAHLFAPMGFLDGTYFHRAYWVYGRSYAGGHSGYHQAGKYAPAGRLLVADEENVYGFGRKPEHYKWTTILEHQLFASTKAPPEQARGDAAAEAKATRRGAGTNMIRFEKSKSLDPTGQAIVASAWVNAESPNGVVLARGGPAVGYALILKAGKPRWMVRTSEEKLSSIGAKKSIVGSWTHLVGVLTKDKQLRLFVNGKLAASGEAAGLIPSDPAQSLEIGGDEGGAVGTYTSPNLLMGTIDEVRLYHGAISEDEIKSLASTDNDRNIKLAEAKLVLSCSFDAKNAKDTSGNNNHGKLDGNRTTDGKLGLAMRFRGQSGGNQNAGSFVKHHWTQDVPLLVRAMVKADETLFIAGPPDLMDEAETFKQLTENDPQVQELLAKQDAALSGSDGAVLQAVSAKDGGVQNTIKLPSLPVWDSLIAANGNLYLATEDGKVICFAGK